MTVWGGWTNHLRIGLDIWTDGYDTWTPSVNVYVQVSVQCDPSWNFNDSQTAVLSGSVGGSWTWQNTLGANQTVVVGTAVIYGQGQSYGGGPTYSFHAQINGVYLGAGPVVDYAWALPPRPTRAPSPPGAPVWRNTKATSTDFGFSDSTDYGGIAPDSYAVHIATDSGFANIIRNQNAFPGGTTVSGLAPGTTYWGRDFTHNGAGWSAASGVTAITTNAYQLGAPTVAAQANTATVTWGDPPTSDPPTQYNLQIATDAGFTKLAGDFTAAWAKVFNATGLTPGTTYFYRVRASTSTGWGAWSPASSGKTLSGAKVRTGGTWKDAIVWVRVGGAWKQTSAVNKRVSGAWKV